MTLPKPPTSDPSGPSYHIFFYAVVEREDIYIIAIECADKRVLELLLLGGSLVWLNDLCHKEIVQSRIGGKLRVETGHEDVALP